MKFEFFEKLSSEKAQTFLEKFLSLESSKIGELLSQCSSDGIKTDFSIESVGPMMRWVASKLTTIPQAPDDQLPWWIRNTDSYTKNLFELDEPSKILTLLTAYYLGESFVRNFSGLHWALGNPDTAEANMPVVSGFQLGLEMAPILVAENLLRRVIAEPAKIGDIDRAVEYWKQRA